jgi:hypothetical protein
VNVAHHTTHTSQHAGRPASRQSLARLHGAHEVLPALLSHTVKVLFDGSRYNIAFVSACNLLQLVCYISLKCKPTFGVQQKPCGLCPWTPDLSLQSSICIIQQKQCSSISLTLLSPSGLFVELLNRKFWHDPNRSEQPSKNLLDLHSSFGKVLWGAPPDPLALLLGKASFEFLLAAHLTTDIPTRDNEQAASVYQVPRLRSSLWSETNLPPWFRPPNSSTSF